MSEVVDKRDGMFVWGVFDIFSILDEDSFWSSQVGTDKVDIFVELVHESSSIKQMLSFFEGTVDADLPDERGSFDLTRGEEFCEHDQIRVYLSGLLYHMLGHI